MPLRLTGRQLDVMRLLWDRGEMAVAEVQEALSAEVPLAYSTVATVLSRLEKRGLVQHRQEGRTYYFRPSVSETGVVQEVVDRLFHGSPSQLVSHLLESQALTAEELQRIRELIEAYERPKSRRRGKSNR